MFTGVICYDTIEKLLKLDNRKIMPFIILSIFSILISIIPKGFYVLTRLQIILD